MVNALARLASTRLPPAETDDDLLEGLLAEARAALPVMDMSLLASVAGSLEQLGHAPPPEWWADFDRWGSWLPACLVVVVVVCCVCGGGGGGCTSISSTLARLRDAASPAYTHRPPTTPLSPANTTAPHCEQTPL